MVNKDKAILSSNIVVAAIGIALMAYYAACESSCSFLAGTLAGIDLKVIGILFMSVMSIASSPILDKQFYYVNHLRTAMLAAAVGGEILLVRFQILEDTFCPYCLAFGSCLLVMFILNMQKMSWKLAVPAFLAGIGIFLLFFNGSVLPTYN